MFKNAIWFIKQSKEFTGYSYTRMLFKEKLIRRTVKFILNTIEFDKLKKKYGSMNAYLITNRVIEM